MTRPLGITVATVPVARDARYATEQEAEVYRGALTPEDEDSTVVVAVTLHHPYLRVHQSERPYVAVSIDVDEEAKREGIAAANAALSAR